MSQVDVRREGEPKSFQDGWMALSGDVKQIVPETSLSYLKRTDQMHCGPGEGGSKFQDRRVQSIFDVLKMRDDLVARIQSRTDDREALRAAGAPENAFLPATKGPGTPEGLPEALYFKVDGVEGRLGIVRVGDLPAETKVLVRREKGHGNPEIRQNYCPVSFTVVQGSVADMPRTDFATIIVGREGGDQGKDQLWTIHPGAPIRPAMGEFDFSKDLLGPDEIQAGETQPVRVMSLGELKAKASLGEGDFIKIVPGNFEETVGKFRVLE
jgi:hypothetical protein